MRERFRRSSEVEKGILRSVRRLYYAGIYGEREIFSIERIKHVCEKREEIERKQYEWMELLKELKHKGFIEIRKDEVWVEETYLAFVIEDDLSALDNLNDMMDVFSNDSEALFSLGNRAYHIGIIDIQKAKYMRLAIEAFEQALEAYTLDRFPMEYAFTQSNLGTAYNTLAEVEDKAGNCKRAIEACEQALEVFTKEESPEMHRLAELNLRILFDFCGANE